MALLADSCWSFLPHVGLATEAFLPCVSMAEGVNGIGRANGVLSGTVVALAVEVTHSNTNQMHNFTDLEGNEIAQVNANKAHLVACSPTKLRPCVPRTDASPGLPRIATTMPRGIECCSALMSMVKHMRSIKICTHIAGRRRVQSCRTPPAPEHPPQGDEHSL